MAGKLNRLKKRLFIKWLHRGAESPEDMMWNLGELQEKSYWTLVQ
jgi:hypothetical protein